MAHTIEGGLIQPSITYSKYKAFTITAHIARVLIGLIFLVFGLNGFLHFIPMPAQTGAAADFSMGLFKGQYFFPLMALTQVISGVLLLSGTLVPLALLLLSPIVVNIFFFHLALAPSGLGMAIFIVAAVILLTVYYWPVYKPIFSTNNAWKSNRLK
ncbi:MAG: DoxX family membrane protein [Ginsengibacter sp.]